MSAQIPRLIMEWRPLLCSGGHPPQIVFVVIYELFMYFIPTKARTLIFPTKAPVFSVMPTCKWPVYGENEPEGCRRLYSLLLLKSFRPHGQLPTPSFVPPPPPPPPSNEAVCCPAGHQVHKNVQRRRFPWPLINQHHGYFPGPGPGVGRGGSSQRTCDWSRFLSWHRTEWPEGWWQGILTAHIFLMTMVKSVAVKWDYTLPGQNRTLYVDPEAPALPARQQPATVH